MKRNRWIALLVTLSLAACAPPTVTTTSTTTTTTVPAAPREIVNQPATSSPDTGNCGTPSDPQACPPLPRAPLPYYPGDREAR